MKKFLKIALLMFIVVGMFTISVYADGEDVEEEAITEVEEAVEAEEAVEETRALPKDVYVDSVSFTITPPADGENVSVVWDDGIAQSQTTQPVVTMAEGSGVSNVDSYDGKNMAYWLDSPSVESRDTIFEGTYKSGDTFYAVLGFELPANFFNVTSSSMYMYHWADLIKIDITGATIVSQYVDARGYLTVIVQGSVPGSASSSSDSAPSSYDSLPVEFTVPKTGVDKMPTMNAIESIGVLTLCAVALMLNKKN